MKMQDEKQYEQLIMQYQQLKNGSIDIAGMIEREDYDSAITMIKSREDIFLNCKCIMNYLELTPVQKKEIDKIVDEIRELELKNIKTLEKGMEQVQSELKKSQQTQKFHQAYDNDPNASGSIINVSE